MMLEAKVIVEDGEDLHEADKYDVEKSQETGGCNLLREMNYSQYIRIGISI